VDSNTGRSSTAVATNSAFRGIYAFVATEVAVPLQVSVITAYFTCHVTNDELQDGLGDGKYEIQAQATPSDSCLQDGCIQYGRV
jgi:hypothetical protein